MLCLNKYHTTQVVWLWKAKLLMLSKNPSCFQIQSIKIFSLGDLSALLNTKKLLNFHV